MYHERPSQRDALLLAARELRRQAFGKSFHLDKSEHVIGLLTPLGLAHTMHFLTEGDVVEALQVREEGIILEHHSRASACRGQVIDRLPAKHDLAIGDPLMAGDHAQRGCIT